VVGGEALRLIPNAVIYRAHLLMLERCYFGRNETHGYRSRLALTIDFNTTCDFLTSTLHPRYLIPSFQHHSTPFQIWPMLGAHTDASRRLAAFESNLPQFPPTHLTGTTFTRLRSRGSSHVPVGSSHHSNSLCHHGFLFRRRQALGERRYVTYLLSPSMPGVALDAGLLASPSGA